MLSVIATDRAAFLLAGATVRARSLTSSSDSGRRHVEARAMPELPHAERKLKGNAERIRNPFENHDAKP